MSMEYCFNCDNEFDTDFDEGAYTRNKHDDPSFIGEYVCRGCIEKAEDEYNSRLAAEEDHGRSRQQEAQYDE